MTEFLTLTELWRFSLGFTSHAKVGKLGRNLILGFQFFNPRSNYLTSQDPRSFPLLIFTDHKRFYALFTSLKTFGAPLMKQVRNPRVCCQEILLFKSASAVLVAAPFLPNEK